MCWNAEVSLNTFLFSFFVLGLLIYNNTYTKYKIDELNNIYVYLFFMSIIGIQLVEFFIWRNIKNPSYTHWLSIIGIILVMTQPLFALLLIKNPTIGTNAALGYACIAIPMFFYNISVYSPNVKVSKLGNLQWYLWWGEYWTRQLWYIVYWVCIVFGLIASKKYTMLLFGIISFLWSGFNFYRMNTIGSLFCWSINTVAILIAFHLLIYLPFQYN